MTLPLPHRGRRRLVIPRGSLKGGFPFAAVFTLDRGRHGTRHLAALLIVLAVHGFMAAAVAAQHEATAHTRVALPRPEIHASLEHVIPPPAPPPPPEPPRSVAPRAPRSSPSEPPPAPAQAGKVIAQAPVADDPSDLTSFDLVVGQAESYAGGVSSGKGTSRHEVLDPGAKVGGVPDAPSAPDLSRPATPAYSDWSCGWPEEAIDSEVRSARATIRVTVDANGYPDQVDVLSAPPGGFAEAARHCAEHEVYRAALDRLGKPVAGATHAFNVHFLR